MLRTLFCLLLLLLPPLTELHLANNFPGLLWETCVPPPHDPSSRPSPERIANSTPFATLDPLPYRLDNHHRTPKDPALLRPQTKSQRHSRLLRRPPPHLTPLDLHRLPRRGVRHRDTVRRLPRDDCWLRARAARRGTVYRRGCGQNGYWATKR